MGNFAENLNLGNRFRPPPHDLFYKVRPINESVERRFTDRPGFWTLQLSNSLPDVINQTGKSRWFKHLPV